MKPDIQEWMNNPLKATALRKILDDPIFQEAAEIIKQTSSAYVIASQGNKRENLTQEAPILLGSDIGRASVFVDFERLATPMDNEETVIPFPTYGNN